MKKPFKRKYFYYTLLILLVLLIKGAVYSDIPIEELTKKYANEHSKFIEIDGMNIHYRDEGKGTQIVLLHGTASSLHTWDDWTTEFKRNYRVIRLDLPAFGLTGPNKTGNYSIKNYTNFLDKFLIEMQLDSMHLAGNSLGGNIAWNYAAEHPEKIQKLVLVDASGLPTNKPQPWIFKMAKTPVVNSLFLYMTPKMIIKDNMEQVYEDDSKVTDELITRYHEMTLREGNRQAFIDRAKTDFKLGDKGNIEKLKSVQTETLLLWGENDTWIPLDNGKRMDSIMLNSELVILKNTGHVPMEENPAESLSVVMDFLNKKDLEEKPM